MAGLDPCIAVRRICHRCGIIWAASESERTSVGEGTYACGDPHRLGIRPAWIAEAGMPSLLIRLRPQRFGDRLIRHGNQMLHRKSYPPQGLENRMIRRGSQTPWCGLQASPRLGEPMRRTGHDPSRCPNPIMPPAKGDQPVSY